MIKNKRKQLLKRSIYPLVILGFLIYFLNSAAMLQYSVKFAQRIAPGKIEIENLNGKLIGPIFVKKIIYQHNYDELSIQDLFLDWKPLAFLKGDLIISKLNISELKYHSTLSKAQSKNENISVLTKQLQLANKIIQKAKIDNFIIDTLAISATGSLQLDNMWNAHWQAEIAKLENFSNEYAGKLLFTGAITGARNIPEMNIAIIGENIKMGIIQVGYFDNKIHYTHLAHNPLQLYLNAKNIKGINYSLDNISLALQTQKQGQSTLAKFVMGPTILKYLFNNKYYSVPIKGINLNSSFDKSGLKNDLTLQLSSQQYLKTTLNLPEFTSFNLSNKNQAIEGKLSLTLQQLNLLSLNSVKLTDISGGLQINSTISGSLNSPLLHNQIKLTHASANINELGIRILGMELQGNSDINKYGIGDIEFSGHANSSTGGVLYLQGHSNANPKELSTVFTLKGNSVGIMNTKEFQLIASPDITAKISQNRMDITGTLEIPRATLNFSDSRSNSAFVTNDIVFVSKNKKIENPDIFNAYARLKISFGDNVKLQADGLTGKLKGTLNLFDTPTGITTATGNLEIIDGKYQAYGQTFTVRKGARLMFNGGPIIDPALNIQTVREVTVSRDAIFSNQTNLFNQNFSSILNNPADAFSKMAQITVGISVQGTLKNQQLTLFSEPAILNQSEILSYLILGRPMSAASTADAQLLLQAASTLSPGSGQLSNIIQQLRQTFSLDELGIESVPQLTPGTNVIEQNTSLVLGKALSPKLYIHYSIGLIKPINTLRISYLLSKQWRLQTESNSLANGIDVLYSIEH